MTFEEKQRLVFSEIRRRGFVMNEKEVNDHISNDIDHGSDLWLRDSYNAGAAGEFERIIGDILRLKQAVGDQSFVLCSELVGQLMKNAPKGTRRSRYTTITVEYHEEAYKFDREEYLAGAKYELERTLDVIEQHISRCKQARIELVDNEMLTLRIVKSILKEYDLVSSVERQVKRGQNLVEQILEQGLKVASVTLKAGEDE